MKKSLAIKTLIAVLLICVCAFSLTACFGNTKVMFVVDGAIPYTIETDGNEKLNLPVPPKKGYVFKGWYYDNETFEQPFKEDSLIGVRLDKSIKVYAKFIEEGKAEIKLNKNIDVAGSVSGGGILDLGSSATITATTNPGYTFDGWFEGENLITTEANYTFEVLTDRTFTAKWTVQKFNVIYRSERTFKINGSSDGITFDGTYYTYTAQVEFGTLFYPQGGISTGDYEFTGWFYQGGGKCEGGFIWDKTEDLTLNAGWEYNEDWSGLY